MAHRAIDGSRRLFWQKDAHLKVIDALNHADIESRPLWKPMHLQPVFKGAICECDGTSESIFARDLPTSGTNMSDSEIDKVCEIIKANI